MRSAGPGRVRASGTGGARRRCLLATGPSDHRESKARQPAITVEPGDCHVKICAKFNMQAAMAVVLAKRWPYVRGVEMAVT